ncbi:hypothetical protein D1872_268700 [compost metagenome]
MDRLLSRFEKTIIANIPGAIQLPVPLSFFNIARKSAYGLAGLSLTPSRTGSTVIRPYGGFLDTSAHCIL